MSTRTPAADDGPIQRRPLEDTVERFGFADLIAGSESMERVAALGRRAAAANSPVLIEGEPGVGKAGIARAIHGESARTAEPFVTVNCGAMGEASGTGNFMHSAGGTVFLDEVSALPLQAQAMVLDRLQDGEKDFGLICATGRNLIARVQEKRFREDLYYRQTCSLSGSRRCGGAWRTFPNSCAVSRRASPPGKAKLLTASTPTPSPCFSAILGPAIQGSSKTPGSGLSYTPIRQRSG